MGCVSSPASMAARMVRAQVFGVLPSMRVCRRRRTSSARLLSMMKFWNALKVFRGAAGAAGRSRMRIVRATLSMVITVLPDSVLLLQHLQHLQHLQQLFLREGESPITI